VDADYWSRWRQETFSGPYPGWYDGPDFAALLAAARRDPAHVARMLRAGLAAEDPLAARGLAELADAGSAPADAADTLRRAAGTATGEFLIRVAEALYVLTADPAWADRIAEVLGEDQPESVRLEAAMALAGFPPRRAPVAALAAAVTDPAYPVRYHAATTLIRYAGGTGGFVDGPGLFAALGSDDPGRWRAAAAELVAHVS
jgi:HEAT repeat protein